MKSSINILKKMSDLPCFCGSKKLFSNCCQPFLEGRCNASTPELLMRSRYSAFCKKNIEYLIATSHPSRRKLDDRQQLERTCETTQWLALKMIAASIDKTHPDTGVVEFVAFYQAQVIGQLHEKSTFVREKGQWYYLKGDILPPLVFKRNQTCWCRSGKKYKRCHGQ